MNKLLSFKSTKFSIFKSFFICLVIFTMIVTICSQSDFTADASSSTTENVTLTVTYGQTDAREMLDLVNSLRTTVGVSYWNEDNSTKTTFNTSGSTYLEALTYDYELEKIAMQRAAEIAISFAHERPDGSGFSTAAASISYSVYGENIAAGQTTYKAAFTAWEESSAAYSGQGHRRNMLYSDYNAIGIGHVVFQNRHYWVQILANKNIDSIATDAVDSSKDVDVSVSSTLVTSLTSSSSSSITIDIDESAALPNQYKLTLNDSWPSTAKNTISANTVWSIDDTSIACISGDTIIGKAAGTTTISTTLLGKAFSHTVTVKCTNHTYNSGEITLAATCSEAGTKTYTCTKCGDTYTGGISALGHSYSPSYTWSSDYSACTMSLTCSNDSSHKITNISMTVSSKDTVTSTCISTGSRKYTAACTYSGTSYKTEKTIKTNIASTNHPADKIVTTPGTAATCTTSGTTDTTECTACGKIISGPTTISATGHNYTTSYSWSSDYTSCTVTFTCSNNCGTVFPDKDADVSSKVSSAATCSKTGILMHTAKCTYRGTTYTTLKTENIPIDSDNHANIVTDVSTAATCTAEGKTQGSHCADCGTVITKQEATAVTAHSFTAQTIDSSKLKSAATYSSPAVYYYSCASCGKAGTNTFTYGDALEKVTPNVTVSYHTHIQTYGDSKGVQTNGQMSGTSGESKRLENIWIKVSGNSNLGIQYTTHCQSYGWMSWSSDGDSNGTSGEAKRMEAIKIKLTGSDADKYDVYYRVHAQSYGWLGWAKNGEAAGTSGYSKRLEGIQIVVLKKGEAAPGLNYAGINATSSANSNSAYISKTASEDTVSESSSDASVSYRTHVQSYGWQAWVKNGTTSGTSGQSKRLEAINIKLANASYSGDIVYTTHVQSYGWQGDENDSSTWKKNGELSGTSGQSKRLEAIRIALTGEMAEHYDIYYRVHAQSYGWLGWAKNGEAAGTAGLSKRLEGIQIVLVPKGEAAPSNTYNGVSSVLTRAYIQK